MVDAGKTKKQLIAELAGMRRRVAELEKAEAERRRAEQRLKELNETLEMRVQLRTADLLAANDQLMSEILQRRRAEKSLEKHRDRLEGLVEERTAELTQTVGELQSEIAERRRAEQEARRSRDYLNIIANSISDGLIVIEKDFTISYANKAAADQAGMDTEEMIGQHCYRVSHNRQERCLPPEHECPLEAIFETKLPQVVLHRHVDRAGNESWIEVGCAPVLDERGEVARVVEATRDITERKRMEQELAQSEKLASLGVLSGGAAHEIINPLNTISAYVQRFLRDGALEPKRHLDSRQMLAEVERISEIVSGLGAFAQQMKSVRQRVDVQEELDRALRRLEQEVRWRGVDVLVNFLPTSLMVMANPALLAQAFEKILDNALESMPEGGTLTLQTEVADRDEGPWVSVSITDTGVGIPPEHLSKVFDPFFTTREVGEGKGLGLSVALGIVKAHGGSVEVESEEGRRTTFTVRLPLEPAVEIGPD